MDDGGACVRVAKRTHSGNEVFTLFIKLEQLCSFLEGENI
jgi:hypothetical protein